MRQNHFILSCTCINVKSISSNSLTKIYFAIEYIICKLIIVKCEMCYIKVHKVTKGKFNIYCTKILHIL